MPTSFEETLQLVNLLSRNQLIFLISCVSFSVMFSIYVSSTILRVIERQKYHMSSLMEGVDDILFSIQRLSIARFEKYLKDTNQFDNNVMIAFQSLIHSTLFMRTRERVKRAIHKNGFHTKHGEELDRYIEIVGGRLRNKAQSDLEVDSRELSDLIRVTNEIRYSTREGLEDWRKIVMLAKDTQKAEIRDIVKIIFFWRLKDD